MSTRRHGIASLVLLREVPWPWRFQMANGVRPSPTEQRHTLDAGRLDW